MEIDDHLPSFRVSVRILIEQFQQKIQYEGAFWIECVVWDVFVKNLRSPSMDEISLHDMNERFLLFVKNAGQGLSLQWSLTKADVNQKRHVTVNFTSAIDEEVLAKIYHQFDEFPAWW